MDDGPMPRSSASQASADGSASTPPSLESGVAGHDGDSVADETAQRRDLGPAALRVVGTVAGVALLADQLTKHWAVNRLSDGSTIDLIGSLRFRLAFNTGMAFSIGSGNGWVYAVLAVLISIALTRSALRFSRIRDAVPVGMVVGGALGNVADRAFRAGDGLLGGAVVDFVDLQWYPVFNVADACVVLGAIWLVAVMATTSPDV